MNKISRVIRIAAAIGLALALGLLAACAADTGGTSSTGAPASGASAEPPTLKLVEPAASGTVAAGTVTVAVETTGLEFVMPSSTNVAGQGHVHFTLDDQPFVMSVEKQATLKDVAPGPHKLIAELVQNDTSPLNPPVRQEIEFTAQ